MTMRVLHLYAGNLYGGVESSLVTLARHRELSNVEPAFGLCFEGRLSRELREAGAEVEILGAARFAKPWTVLQARRNLRRLIGREHFDLAICHSAWPHAIFAPVVQNAGMPLVYWAHDPFSGHWLERLANRTPPALLIANSHFNLAMQGELFTHSERKVLRPPVTPPQVLQPAARDRLRREVETSTDDVVIVCCSRLESWKGHMLLLGAMKKLMDLPNWRVWIAGSPQRSAEAEYLRSLRASASAAGLDDRVRFIGERSDVPAILQSADIYSQPNVGPETFGIVFIEALYAGLPVVTTNIGAAPEIVNEDCGALVLQSEEQLADTLKSLVEDASLRCRLGSAGPKRAAELCDPAVTMPIIERAFQGVIERTRVSQPVA